MTDRTTPSDAPRPLRVAHRGDWRRAPENTLPALLAALEVPGCDGVEFDVRAAGDGTPVLLHDRTLARVQRRPERVDQLPLETLAEAGIPTLAEVLAALPRTAWLDIELKNDPGPQALEVIAAARGETLENAVVTSFQPATVAAVRAGHPDWPCWLNADDLSPATVDLAVELGCSGISARWASVVRPRSLARARDRGLDVAAWTIRTVAIRSRLDGLDIVAACVEGPALDP